MRVTEMNDIRGPLFHVMFLYSREYEGGNICTHVCSKVIGICSRVCCILRNVISSCFKQTLFQ